MLGSVHCFKKIIKAAEIRAKTGNLNYFKNFMRVEVKWSP